MRDNVAVLGGGIAGIAAAYLLLKEQQSVNLYEKTRNIGGLLKNFSIDGYRFDQAIHLSFAKEETVREIFDQTDFHIHQPESKCRYNGIWLRHPVQNNLFPLPGKDKTEIIESFVARQDRHIENYDDWLRHQFGDVFTDLFPKPYTDKYWDMDTKKMGVDWISNRMHRASLKEVLDGAFSSDVPNYYYAKEMRYPKRGGYISFLNPMIDKVSTSTHLEHELVQIDLAKSSAVFSSGKKIFFNQLISTIPLPNLISHIKHVPKNIKEAANKLEWTKVHLVSLGFDKPDLVKDLWFYIYDEDILAARAYSPSLKSPDNVPAGGSSLQFEIYESSKNTNKFSGKNLIENCLYAIEKLKIANRSNVVVSDLRTLEFGNVSFYKGMELDRNLVRDWVEAQGILLAGRFGEWEYLWSNQAMVSGLTAGQKAVKLINS